MDLAWCLTTRANQEIYQYDKELVNLATRSSSTRQPTATAVLTDSYIHDIDDKPATHAGKIDAPWTGVEALDKCHDACA
jgi:hypothetical protein